LKIKEIEVQSVLQKATQSDSSEVTGPGIDYTLDPYQGCQHACKYCYVFRNQFIEKGDESHANDFWGDFVDLKINAPQILEKEIKNTKRGGVLLSSLTDPYQPLEHKYRLTRACLEILLKNNFRVLVLTKSDLINRDLDLFLKFNKADVGLTITTDDDSVREIIEPHSASVEDRINTLRNFHSRKINTYAHIGPILPMSPSELVDQIGDNIDYAIIDKMNYISPELEELYQRNGFDYALGDEYFKAKETELRRLLERKNVRIW
jgi:DNA repair photolyase